MQPLLRKAAYTTTLTLIYGAVSLPAVAAESKLEEVMVTAQKREQNLQDVPIAVTAFTGEQMNAFGVQQSFDIATFTPGVHISGNLAGQNTQFSIRGVTQNDFNDIIEAPNAVYLDEGYIAIAQGQTFAVFDIDRVEILRDLRLAEFDVLIGINLLREGLDLPEVALVAILDADKEGFLRSARSLIQTAGRAARNKEGEVILYADVLTDSIKKTIDETDRRRKAQQRRALRDGQRHARGRAERRRSVSNLFACQGRGRRRVAVQHVGLHNRSTGTFDERPGKGTRQSGCPTAPR